MSEVFERELKNQQVIELLNSTNSDGSVVFQLNQDETDEDDNKLVEDYERELMERAYNIVPQDAKNPSAGMPFEEFRNEMTMLNEKIYKKIIKPGAGADIDLERTTISYDYAMFLEAAIDPFDSSILNKKPGVASVRKGIEPTPGCYLALASMKKGEEAVFWISNELMFGKLGCSPRVPPAADILFSVKVIKSENQDEDEKENEIRVGKSFEKIWKKAAKNYKIAGEQFKLWNFSNAIEIYREWIEKLVNVRMKDDEEEKMQKQLLIKMYQNICVCYNKVEKPEKTCVMMRELEKLAPIGDNPKALYAKGKANMMLNNFEDARRYFMVAKRLAPTDTSIANALCELIRRENAKLQFEFKAEELASKFESEALEIAEEKQKEVEERRQAQQELHEHLDKFKGKVERKIMDLKSDKAIENLNLTIETHFHIEVADEMCQQHQVQLKGTQILSGEKKIYYLSK